MHFKYEVHNPIFLISLLSLVAFLTLSPLKVITCSNTSSFLDAEHQYDQPPYSLPRSALMNSHIFHRRIQLLEVLSSHEPLF